MKVALCDFCEEPIEGKSRIWSTDDGGSVRDFCGPTCLIDFINNKEETK